MKRTKYPIHPDFQKWANMNPPLHKATIPVMQKLMGLLFTRERSTADVTVEWKVIPVGGGTIRALWYCPKDVGEHAPCLLYYHGGGFVLPAALYHYSLAKEYAQRAHCKVLFVDYRLAPRFPFPAAPEDCYLAYAWAASNAGDLSIDTSRTESMKKYTDTPMCNSQDAEKYDKLYRPAPSAGKLEYASPIQAESLAGLPAAYIETAEFDCLRDGGILYAERLRKFGVPVELHNTEETMHGFDIVLDSPIVRNCVDRRTAFLKKIFS